MRRGVRKSLSPPGPIAQDLRAVVARRVGVDRKVALLSADPSLRAALEANRCTVLADPESLEQLRAFEPQVVVAFDGFLQGDAATNFATIAGTAPSAELLVSFANAASASALLAALAGKAVQPGFGEPEVRGWLRQAGFAVRSVDRVVAKASLSGLALDAESAVRQLLEQLNPEVTADRLLVRAVREQAREQERVAGRVSVIVAAEEGGPALDGTLRSLSRQALDALELVVVGPRAVAESSRVAVVAIESPSTDFAAQLNLGLERASGQYVAFARRGDLFDAGHFHQLRRALADGVSAWAVSEPRVAAKPGSPEPMSARRVFVAAQKALETAAGVPAKSPPRPPWAARLEQSGLGACAWLFDRSRLGRFPLVFADATPNAESLLFARAAALFPFVAVDGATCEPGPPRAALELNVRQSLVGRPFRALVSFKDLL